MQYREKFYPGASKGFSGAQQSYGSSMTSNDKPSYQAPASSENVRVYTPYSGKDE